MPFKSGKITFFPESGKAGYVTGTGFIGGYFVFPKKFEGKMKIKIIFQNTNDPSKNEELWVTHDMIKCATVLAMGKIFDEEGRIGGKKRKGIEYCGAKYLMVLKDGRQAVLTVWSLENQLGVENLLF